MTVRVLHGLQDKEEIIGLLESESAVSFLLQSEQPLFQFIDELKLEGRLLARLQIANEVVFGCEAYIQGATERTSVASLSDVVRLYSGQAGHECSLVLATEDHDLVSNVMQQIVYLDLDIRVMMEREEEDLRRVQALLQNVGELQGVVAEAAQFVNGTVMYNEGEEEGQSYADLLSKLSSHFEQVDNQPLHVVVMGTKKAGKSVVVNSLLGEEYAPASLELPTSVPCIYKSSADYGVVVEHGSERHAFPDANAARMYMTKQFKLAQFNLDTETRADEIVVHYPVQNEKMRRYTIVDTPGPDFAGAEHREAAYNWIQKADVILFVMDYAKHLTHSEEQYLQEVKRQFERAGKFYSLIIVVNKLDEIYKSQEAKSPVRSLDYLRTRLQNLGYKGFTITGMSALSYFLSLKVPRIPGCERLNTASQRELQNAFRDCRALYRGKPEMTSISFLRTQMDNLLDFFGIEATLDTVREKSGVPRLIQYADYIAGQKAAVESRKQHLVEVDHISKQLQQKLRRDQFHALLQHKDIMEEKAAVIAAKGQEMGGILQRMEMTIVERALIESIRSMYLGMLQDIEASLIEKTELEISTQVRRFLEGLSNWKADELQVKVQQDTFLRAEILPLLKLDEIGRMSELFYEKQLQAVQQKVQDRLKRKEGELTESISDFKAVIAELSQFVQKEYALIDMAVAIPVLDASFYKPVALSEESIIIEPKLIAAKIENHIVEKGFFKKLLSLLLFKWEKHDLRTDSLVRDLEAEVKGHVVKKLQELHADVLAHIDVQFKQLQQRLYEEVQEVLRAYKLLFATIEGDMNSEKARVTDTLILIDKQMELVQYLEEHFSQYFTRWRHVVARDVQQETAAEPGAVPEQEEKQAEEAEAEPVLQT